MGALLSIKNGVLAAGAVAAYYWLKRNGPPGDHPAAAFAGPGGAKDSPVQVRDSGPAHMRDTQKHWDKTDEAADQSFPASDPPSTY